MVDEFARAVLGERRSVLTVRRSRGRDVGRSLRATRAWLAKVRSILRTARAAAY